MDERRKMTAPELRAMKMRGEKISMLTTYDYPMGQLVDQAGIDIALIGDSLGRVVLGYKNELQVTMEDIISHAAAVARGAKRALVVADLPFMSYQVSDEEAVRNAGRLVRESGAEVVKLEGAAYLSAIRKIIAAGIPVMGHVGLTPQSVHQLGGVRKKVGKDADSAARVKSDALDLQDAGVCGIVLEAIPADLAANITNSLDIPTFGIGAGPDCDGQVVVMHDILGLYREFRPSFVKLYADIWQATLDAFSAYNSDVKEGRFPVRK
ncbi:MAG: 3-methyl-2-oxobutanoate hydroxymethyltransferase [Armatimonadota bacterium]|nr:3-methyl-2-oxobutanoate hydroxymethyltransferase [bacterium]